MKIVTVVGARPQFIKAAIVSKGLAENNFDEFLIHTGQHFDKNMSDVFFEELGMDQPALNLGIVESSHAAQTGRMMMELEKAFIEQKPGCVLVYGDTNSTIAAALAAAKLHIPVAHVEAGLRSFNRKMPEELNRIVTDQLSDVMYSTSPVASKHLENEGITKERIVEVGDVMFDAILHYSQVLEANPEKGSALARSGEFVLATIHRAENTDNPDRLRNIFDVLVSLSEKMKVILPLHPRTRKTLDVLKLMEHYGEKINFVDPVGYLGMIDLMKNASLVATDSGGVQKEAYYLKTPCVTFRDETEWVETIERGANRLLAPERPLNELISEAKESVFQGFQDNGADLLYGGGQATKAIVEDLLTRYAGR